MKKLTQLLTGVLLAVGTVTVLASPQTAYALTCSGEITNTGEGSINIITCEDEQSVELICENGVFIDNANNQEGESGQGMQTGDVINVNETTITIGVTGCGQEEVPVTPEVPTGGTTPATPSTPASPAAPATPATKPVVLPHTANNSVVYVAVGLIVLVAVAVATRTGLALYRRHTSK